MRAESHQTIQQARFIVFLLSSSACAAMAWAGEPGLTFFGWSDQHIKTDGDGRHLIPAIDAMNGLPGRDFPATIGGKVARPAFVFGCGDITEWPTNAARRTYEELITKRLAFPSYNVLGNHDEGGKVPSDTMKKWLIARRGALSYSFDQGGVHFVAVFSRYDESLDRPAQPITADALDFLRKDLARLAPRTPTVVATHLCFDAMTNRVQFIEAFGDANVILVLGGHYHKAKLDHERGIPFVQLPSPAPGSPNEVTVIRIRDRRLTVVPYDYRRKRWSDDPAKILDVAMRPQQELRVRRPARP